jgi:hypothetical protein
MRIQQTRRLRIPAVRRGWNNRDVVSAGHILVPWMKVSLDKAVTLLHDNRVRVRHRSPISGAFPMSNFSPHLLTTHHPTRSYIVSPSLLIHPSHHSQSVHFTPVFLSPLQTPKPLSPLCVSKLALKKCQAIEKRASVEKCQGRDDMEEGRLVEWGGGGGRKKDNRCF